MSFLQEEKERKKSIRKKNPNFDMKRFISNPFFNAPKLAKLFLNKIAVIVLALLLSVQVSEAQSRKVKRTIAKQEKREKQEERAYEKTRKKVVKQRFAMQSDQTKERMKQTRKKSKEYNDRGREGFIKKLFNEKKRHIRKKRKRR